MNIHKNRTFEMVKIGEDESISRVLHIDSSAPSNTGEI